MVASKQIDASEIAQACRRLASEIAAAHGETEHIYIIGITNGGIVLAQRLSTEAGSQLGRKLECGQVNATFHRDDIGTNPIPAPKERTNIPFDVTGATVIMVDDVIASGRTIRAALNELFDAGRPAKVELAVLFDAGTRKLPIVPDYLGFSEKFLGDRKVRVTLDPERPADDQIEFIS